MKIAYQVTLYFIIVVILVLSAMGIMLNRVYVMNVAHQRLIEEWQELQLSINFLDRVEELLAITSMRSDENFLDVSYMNQMESLVPVLEKIRQNSTRREKFEDKSHVLTEEKKFVDIHEGFDDFLNTVGRIKTSNNLNDTTSRTIILKQLDILRQLGMKLQEFYMKSMGDASVYAQHVRQQILNRTVLLFGVFLVLLGFTATWFVYLINRDTKAMLDREKGLTIGLLAQSLAHEIRNPLGIIKSSASVIQKKLPVNSEEYEITGFLADEVDRIDQLIHQLLQLRKESKEAVKLQDPFPLIEQVTLLLAGACQKASVKINLINNAGEQKILCDSNQIKQVLINIVLNAIQASLADGYVEISTSVSHKTYYIHVRDYGVGFNKEALRKAYDPFYTTKENGLGLGLFVVKNIISAHGGSIVIQPTNPQGATVIIGFKIQG